VGANGEVNAEYFCVLHALADTSLMPSRLTVPMGRWNKGGVDGRTREARIIVGAAAGRERARAGLQNPINCTGGRTTSPVTRTCIRNGMENPRANQTAAGAILYSPVTSTRQTKRHLAFPSARSVQHPV
jgi:hypothetical protein